MHGKVIGLHMSKQFVDGIGPVRGGEISKLSNGFDSWPKSKLSNGFDSWPFGYVVECHSKLSNGFDSWPVGNRVSNGFDSWPKSKTQQRLRFLASRRQSSLNSATASILGNRVSRVCRRVPLSTVSLVRSLNSATASILGQALSSLHLEVLNSLPVGYVGECHCFSFVRALISLHIEVGLSYKFVAP
ncbi:unnamed protein product [Rodentolepis nana]|uniref:Transposase_23 domain-containing protein n=1 Tax=Rodentolepis nana TaxID=102285 RepID=A0A0R3TFE2_RODNA|nr:unnamed protein product [Rodentolepis nana]